ncbi:hypothetical protein H7849_16095 [Alloacidobacterium dinghuense]|uniref:Uncharacterized protein n=1 Tax=Alloacidobacterium dinghuense TaxID=2763107 RepID=A0A7G8BDN1_9BACT|nr:hypothetical protein [Alloacidobacterium dinghuense]QNI30651.1 hypothetical protein H7849_16095 [Alloacidobacterium dinghuense]
MKIRYFLAALVLAASHMATAQQPASSSPLGFTSSIPWLTQSFAWAKEQALAYSRRGSKTMGPWYEAALPGRNAFCMRDVSHQTEGAAALGLYAANRNMLGLFVQSAAESRDWVAYWEIDGEGHPSAADYVSDSDFWFNLPANFDVLDASVRMWRWTGDDTYRNDPVFQRFFRITMSDYIQAWQLAQDKILTRPRIANQRQAEGRFVQSRGIPSYTEGTKDFIFGTDLLAAEYRAIRSFNQITNDKALAQKMQPEADTIQSLIEEVGWSEQGHHYFSTIHKDQTGSGSGDTLVLYFGAAKDPAHIRGALDYVSSPTYWKQINIEEESYVPLTLFRYGRNEAAYQILADISSPQKNRREYPEVSYGVIETIVSGVMGLSPGLIGGDSDLSTISRLPAEHDQAALTGVSIRQNQLDVMQTGTSITRLKNASGPTLRWRAEFPGTLARLKIDGKTVSAKHSTTAEGIAISWTDVTVLSGATVVVRK